MNFTIFFFFSLGRILRLKSDLSDFGWFGSKDSAWDRIYINKVSTYLFRVFNFFLYYLMIQNYRFN